MLYEYMATSGNPAYMKAFGSVMNEMMQWMISNRQADAEEYIDKLCSIKWNNYLTTKEAERIVASMNPKAPWNREVWKQAMDSLGLPVGEPPYYNSCALWVVMNMIYSDSAESIARIMGKDLNSVDSADLVKAIYSLALDKLKDTDGHFSIRRYFEL